MSASEEAKGIDDGTRMGRDDRAENGKASTMLFHLSLLVPFQIRYSKTPSSTCAQSEYMAAFRSGNSPPFSVLVSLQHRGPWL
jgi:hypothetical protein